MAANAKRASDGAARGPALDPDPRSPPRTSADEMYSRLPSGPKGYTDGGLQRATSMPIPKPSGAAAAAASVDSNAPTAAGAGTPDGAGTPASSSLMRSLPGLQPVAAHFDRQVESLQRRWNSLRDMLPHRGQDTSGAGAGPPPQPQPDGSTAVPLHHGTQPEAGGAWDPSSQKARYRAASPWSAPGSPSVDAPASPPAASPTPGGPGVFLQMLRGGLPRHERDPNAPSIGDALADHMRASRDHMRDAGAAIKASGVKARDKISGAVDQAVDRMKSGLSDLRPGSGYSSTQAPAPSFPTSPPLTIGAVSDGASPGAAQSHNLDGQPGFGTASSPSRGGAEQTASSPKAAFDRLLSTRLSLKALGETLSMPINAMHLPRGQGHASDAHNQKAGAPGPGGAANAKPVPPAASAPLPLIDSPSGGFFPLATSAGQGMDSPSDSALQGRNWTNVNPNFMKPSRPAGSPSSPAGSPSHAQPLQPHGADMLQPGDGGKATSLSRALGLDTFSKRLEKKFSLPF